MSYCGSCGGFYSPDCPHRAGAQPGTASACMPAVNPYEQKIVEALAAVVTANAQTHAADLRAHGFTSQADSLEAIGASLQHLFD